MANFKFQGQEYKYFTGSYNDCRHNERAVEVALAIDLVNKYKSGRILEVGDVLSNYISISHDVVDKYEKRKGVIQQDVVDYSPTENYDLIVSISTFEHVGWDDKEGRDPNKVLQAIDRTRWLLKEAGLMVVTMPLGYNDNLDQTVREHRLPFDKLLCMKRDDYNGWDEIGLDAALEMDTSREPSFTGMMRDSNGNEISLNTVYTRFLLIGYIFGRPPRKQVKAVFTATMDAEAG